MVNNSGKSSNKGYKFMVSDTRNPIRLSRFHMGLAIFYLALGGFLAWLAANTNFPLIGVSVLVPFVVLHLMLAYGTRKQDEFSRKVSVLVGVLMLLAIPIGPIIAIKFLPLTVWDKKDDTDQKEDRSGQ
jgi:hypothetical protein